MSDLNHAAAQILDKMREMTPEAAHVAGRVLQIEAIIEAIALPVSWAVIIWLAKKAFAWKKEDDYGDAPVVALIVLGAVAFIMFFLTLIWVDTIPDMFSPDYALAHKILSALHS